MWEREKWTWPHYQASRFVAAGGVRWHIQEIGSGPPLLLIHGTGASTHSWRKLIPLLSPHYSVIAVDLPGHGFSSPAPFARRSIGGMSAGLAALLRELRIEPRYCLGHSAGAVIACRMALDGLLPARVIIGINGAFAPVPRVFLPIARLLSVGPLLPRLLSLAAGRASSVARLLEATGSRLDAEGVQLYARLVQNPAHVAGVLAMMGQWDLEEFATRLPHLIVPLALIVGENDLAVSPRDALWVKDRLPTTKIFSLPKLGHLAHEEDAELVAGLVLRICDAR